ncbi:MmpS family transport accessory protein [Actinoplanes subtropicus]|uniref:MmpS family transport accessory protein n=1 Tax=Actinoplanes subtropicus TaxID=543632 RepID=UPI0004C36600|nr:MmpS family transport accessory protein [Actinoplanes subtropicus]
MTKLDQDGLVPPSDPWPDAPWEGGAAWPPTPPVPEDWPARARTRWWLQGLIAAIVIAAGFGFGLRSEHRPTPRPTPTPAAPAVPAPAVSASPAPATHAVVYLVTAGSGDIGSVQYTDQDGDIITRGGIGLPWRVTFHVTGDRHAFVLIAQRKQGGTGPVTCSITVDGKVLSTTTATGHYGAPECSA